jgi:hypothetical protein
MKLWKTIVLFLVSNSALFSTAITFLISHTGDPNITNYFLLSLLGVLYACDFINMMSITVCKRIVNRLRVNMVMSFIKIFASAVLGVYSLQFNFNHLCEYSNWSEWWDCITTIYIDWDYILASLGLGVLVVVWSGSFGIILTLYVFKDKPE